MPTNPQSDHRDIEPYARLAHRAEALSVTWRQLPPPAKLVVWAGALAIAGPALRRAADSLDVETSDLLQLAQRT